MKRELKLKDYAIFLIFVPAILTLIYLLPSNFREFMVLYPNNPSLISLFLSNFVHIDINHFVDNLVSYFVIMFLILMQVIDRRKFYIEIALIFLFLPWINSIVILHLKNLFTRVLGFSAINSGLLGYLLHSTRHYTRKEYDIKLGNSFILGVFTFNLAVGVLTYAITINFKYIIYTIFLPVSISFLYFERNNLRGILNKIFYLLRSNRKITILEGFIVALSLFFSFAAALIIFPATIVVDGNKVNIVSHLIGYGLGIIFPMIVESVVELKEGKS